MPIWIENNLEESVLESNDVKRERRIAAYSGFVSNSDLSELSSGLIDTSKMELERISIKEMYWQSSDHLWEWSNSSNQTRDTSKNLSISIVNLAFPEMSGKSSTLSLVMNSYYINMPVFTYALYSNEELALYWTFDY